MANSKFDCYVCLLSVALIVLGSAEAQQETPSSGKQSITLVETYM